MKIDITQELQAQALLAARWVQGRVIDQSEEGFVMYVLQEGDPLPDGLQVGEYLYGNAVDRLTDLPIYTGHGG